MITNRQFLVIVGTLIVGLMAVLAVDRHEVCQQRPTSSAGAASPRIHSNCEPGRFRENQPGTRRPAVTGA